MQGYCALCAMELHVRRCLKDPKSFVKGAAILPSYFTSNLKGNSFLLDKAQCIHQLIPP